MVSLFYFFDMNLVSTEVKDHVLLIGLNRPDKMNAFTVEMLHDLAEAYTMLEKDDNLRCGLLFANGYHFTAGLDLGKVAPHVQTGKNLFPEGLIDPFNLNGQERTKPVVVAVKGYCLTVAIELMLAADICVAADNCKFGQIEIRRGIFPFGGATIRFLQRSGWGNAMRYLLTGDYFDSKEAYRIGLVQEVVEGNPFDRALELAQTIADQAPLGVYATLKNARKVLAEAEKAAIPDLLPTVLQLMQTEDAAEGLQSFLERRKAQFKGK